MTSIPIPFIPFPWNYHFKNSIRCIIQKFFFFPVAFEAIRRRIKNPTVGKITSSKIDKMRSIHKGIVTGNFRMFISQWKNCLTYFHSQKTPPPVTSATITLDIVSLLRSFHHAIEFFLLTYSLCSILQRIGFNAIQAIKRRDGTL